MIRLNDENVWSCCVGCGEKNLRLYGVSLVETKNQNTTFRIVDPYGNLPLQIVHGIP